MRLLDFIREVNSHHVLIERDVINAGEIKKWIEEISPRVASPQARKWFQSQLFQYLINRYEDPASVSTIQQAPEGSPDWLVNKINSGDVLYTISPSENLKQEIMSVIDFVNQWSIENPGREPRMRWEQAEDQSKKWHQEMKSSSISDEENQEDLSEIITVYEFDNGFSIVDLTTPGCLNREGSRMGHCVGSYGSRVQQGTTKIFSLRDNKNRPHATIEAMAEEPTFFVNRNDAQIDMFDEGNNIPPLTIEQIKGKENKPPVKKYVPYIKKFLEWGNFKIGGGSYDIENMGLFRTKSGYKTLEEATIVNKKFSNGFKWLKFDDSIIVPDSGSLSQFLVDENNNIIVKFSFYDGYDGPVSWIGISNKTVEKSNPSVISNIIYILNRIDTSIIQKRNISTHRTLNKLGIYYNKGKWGRLKDVGEIENKLSNGKKIVSVESEDGTSNFILDKDNTIALSYDAYNKDKNGETIANVTNLNIEKINGNFMELLKEIKDISGVDIVGGVQLPVDLNDEPLEPSGKIIYRKNGISWFESTPVHQVYPEDANVAFYVAYDKYKNPLYELTISNDESAINIFAILANPSNHSNKFKDGEDILNFILSENFEASNEGFMSEMFSVFNWVKDLLDETTWWRADETAPATLVITQNYEYEPSERDTLQNSTIEEFFDLTGINDFEDDLYFINMYSSFFNGEIINWENEDLERQVEDPVTGEEEIEYFSEEFEAEFTGNVNDYMHPLSS